MVSDAELEGANFFALCGRAGAAKITDHGALQPD
ncbi:MAG: hypothetical protein ACI8W3_002324, partial [Myxococcota bacterium]